MVIAFVDLLGVRAKWHDGGRDAAEKAFERLRSLVATSLADISAATVLGGGIETDSAAVIFDSTEEAAKFMRSLYSRAFLAATRLSDERIWVRGTLASIQAAGSLRLESSLPGFPAVGVFDLEGGLLDAIAIEKSGYKGMRIVVEESLITDAIRRRFRIAVGNQTFIPFRKLANSAYPGRLANGYQDFLWMARQDEQEWRRMKRSMSNRLRWCS